jgi:hypothetical protein
MGVAKRGNKETYRSSRTHKVESLSLQDHTWDGERQSFDSDVSSSRVRGVRRYKRGMGYEGKQGTKRFAAKEGRVFDGVFTVVGEVLYTHNKEGY